MMKKSINRVVPGMFALAGLSLLLLLGIISACTGIPGTSVSQVTPTVAASLTFTISPTISPSPSSVLIEDTVLPADNASATPQPTESKVPSPTMVKSPTPYSSPTPFPTATFTQATGERPTRTASPTPGLFNRRRTKTAYPTWTDTATLTPTITLTPTPPFSYLQLAKPGELSKVTSPFRIEAQVAPGDDGIVKLDLIGEDSRIITRQLLNNKVNIGRRFWIAPYVDFEISAVAEFARLTISVQDNYERVIALSSVDLILLYLGEDEVNDAVNLLEPYVIWYPKKNDVVSGGIVWVGGLIRPVNDQPLILELIDKNGNILGSKEMQPPSPTGEDTHARFDVGVPYTVYEATEVRLTLRQESDNRIPGTIALTSVLITIEP